MPTAPVSDWGDAIMTSTMAALAMFLGAIARIIGFVLILGRRVPWATISGFTPV